MLGVAAAPSVSRRAAASITQDTGVSAGIAGALPANGLNSGASKLPMAVMTAVTGSRDAAVPVVTASLSAPTGSDTATAAAPDCAAVPEVSVADAVVAAADGACIERTSLSAAVCFGRPWVADPARPNGADDVAAASEVADEPLRAARACLGRPDAAAFVPAGADSLLGADSDADVAAPADDLSDDAVVVVPDEAEAFDDLVVDEVDALADDAEVALSDDFSDAFSDDADPAVFADEDPAEDEDPPVSAHAIPTPPNSAAPTPRAMARPPTSPT